MLRAERRADLRPPEAETGQATDWKKVGSLRLACSPDRLLEIEARGHDGQELRRWR